MSIWLLNSDINDGYPYINDTPVEIPPIMKSPYPNIMMCSYSILMMDTIPM